MASGLSIGQWYQVRVQARNDVGLSDFSLSLSILAATFPDTPINLARDDLETTATQIGLTWSKGLSNGGTPILDFRVLYDAGINNWQLLSDGITETSYTTPILTSGTTYKFKIAARNLVGYSGYTTEVSILCATVPEVPDVPVTSVSGATVYIDWDAPANNGAAITSYTVLILQSDGVLSESVSLCDGSDTYIMGLT